jgi:DNA polymerase III alpha subunit
MGFYAPAQIVRDAERHGVVVRAPDVNLSDWDSRLEEVPAGQSGTLHPTHADMAGDIRSKYAVRLGLRQIKGMGEDDAGKVSASRRKGYDSVRDLWLRTGLGRATIERLADGDAFRSLGLDRRAALWVARGLGGMRPADRLPLFDVAAHSDIQREADFALPPMLLGEHVVNDYRYLSLSLKAHPLTFLRARLTVRRIVNHAALREIPNACRVTVAGLVLIRQRPGTANGVIFMTLEDETDIANIIVWPKTFERYRPIVLGARLVAVTGKVQTADGVTHVVADRIEDLTSMLAALSEDARDIAPLARADEVKRNPGVDPRDKRLVANHLHKHPRHEPVGRDLAAIAEATHDVMPRGRNFH